VSDKATDGKGLAYYRARVRWYGRMFSTSMHLRFGLANLFCGVFPDFVSGAFRARVYRLTGLDVGEGAFIMGNLHLTTASPGFNEKLVIGPGVTIADNVTINLDAKVTIGANVGIAPEVKIYTGSHGIGPGSRRLGKNISLPVTIEDGAWVRLGAIIVPGVTVGRGAIVGVGAVVQKDVPPNTYVVGNPAEVVRKLGWGDR
jgi:carbonic anhydrase/acetyltransferase-like protein (isoleucine patch superfamily)